MDTATQRTQADALIDALPQDNHETVVALMRKLAGDINSAVDAKQFSDITNKMKASHELEAMHSEIAQYGPFDYEMDREAVLEKKYGKYGG